MFNADKMLVPTVKAKDRKNMFSFSAMAQAIIDRQEMGKDSIIAICGERRNGKSNWMLKLIKQFIILKKKADNNYHWSWKENFALTPADAPRKAENLPDGSFEVLDEAGDIAYRGDANTIKTKNLIKFFNKSGKKCMLTIWVLPDIYQLNPRILNMCIMLVIVPYRYKKLCASAFVCTRSPNALSQDKFGLERIQKLMSSKKMSPAMYSSSLDGIAHVTQDGKKVEVPYPRQLFKFYKSLPGFKYSHWFRPVECGFEQRYIKHVKDKQLMAHETEEKYVRKTFYDTMRKNYESMLYNLHEKQNMSYQQIANLHRNENGEVPVGRETIARKIGGVRARFEL